MRKYLSTGVFSSFETKSVEKHDEAIDSEKLKNFQTTFHKRTKRIVKETQKKWLNCVDETNLQKLLSTFFVDMNAIEELGRFSHEKALIAIQFTLHMIANHNDIQQKLFEEITLKKDEQNGNDFLNAVVKEVLRLYPPVAIVERILGEETMIGKCVIVL